MHIDLLEALAQKNSVPSHWVSVVSDLMVTSVYSGPVMLQNNGGTFSIQQARAVIVGTAPPLPTPKLQGLTPETWQPGSPIPHQFSPAAGPAAVPATGSQWPPMSQIDLTRLEQMFLQLDQDCDGILQVIHGPAYQNAQTN